MKNKLTNAQKLIKETVEQYFNLDITKDTRVREYIDARAIYFKLAKENTHDTLASIGRSMGRDHATVLHFNRKIEHWLKVDKALKHHYEQINTRLQKAISINPEGFTLAETLEGFYEEQYNQLLAKHKEVMIKYGYFAQRLNKYEPELVEKEGLQLVE